MSIFDSLGTGEEFAPRAAADGLNARRHLGGITRPVASAKKVLLRCFVASEERYSWSAGGRHLLSSCLHLQRTHPCELLLVVGEPPPQRRRVEREVLVFEARRGGLIERLQGQQPLVRREGLIVALVDLGASALLGEQFYRGQEEVHVEAQVGVDRGDQGPLLVGIVAPVAGLAADDAPVLLLDEAGVVLLVGAAAGEGNALL